MAPCIERDLRMVDAIGVPTTNEVAMGHPYPKCNPGATTQRGEGSHELPEFQGFAECVTLKILGRLLKI
jgi:hypothetical protein